ncbi:MAG: flagellar hook-basal body complex protein [Alphaproteobacteria bacterium]|nr:flagellar hook-basal body complex protein [Alphaproteobacteria bacterium]
MSNIYNYISSINALQAEGQAFGAIADNIANATTPGHKAQTTYFSDLLVDAERLRGNIFPSFNGVSAQPRYNNVAEGVFQTSRNDFDVALNGRGFYVVTPQLNDTSDLLLTDAGTLQERVVQGADGEEVYLASGVGSFVQGWPYDPATESFLVGDTVDSLRPIRIDEGAAVFDAAATTTASIAANLNPDSAVGETFGVGLTVFDGTGDADGVRDARTVTATFTKAATFNEWTLDFSGVDATVTDPVAPVTVQFDANGEIVTPTSQSFSVTFANPAASTSVAVDLADMRSFAPASVLLETSSNGFTEGTLADITFRPNGEIIGNFTNGQNQPIAKLAVGDVVNPNLLLPVDSTQFQLSSLNGPLQLVEADVSGRAVFIPNAIENSTTDLATEVTKIIQTQRAYSSAARTLTTVEEMLETATDLKQ